MNSKILYVALLTLLLTACGQKVDGIYAGPFDIRMEFKDGKVKAMGMEYSYVVDGNEVKVQQGPVTVVYTINDDGSLSNQMIGTFKKVGQATKKAESKSESGFFSKLFGSTQARTDVSFSKFRAMTEPDLAIEWKAVDEAGPGSKNAETRCANEADIGAKLGKTFASAPPEEAGAMLTRAFGEFIIDQSFSHSALRDAAKNLGLTKEGIMVATLEEMKTRHPATKEIDKLASRIALNLNADGGLRQGLYKACVTKGSILFR